jgi:hypothetical protein
VALAKMKRRRNVKEEVEREEEPEDTDGNPSSLASVNQGIQIKNEKKRQSGRKRRSTAAVADVSVDDEEEERCVANSRSSTQFIPGCANYHLEIPMIELRQPQAVKWDRALVETTKGLAKAAARVLLLKGGQGDKITMEHIRSSMGEYKPLARPALKAAQELLREVFGFDIILTKDPDNIYVVNTIKSLLSPLLLFTCLPQESCSSSDSRWC